MSAVDPAEHQSCNRHGNRDAEERRHSERDHVDRRVGGGVLVIRAASMTVSKMAKMPRAAPGSSV